MRKKKLENKALKIKYDESDERPTPDLKTYGFSKQQQLGKKKKEKVKNGREKKQRRLFG